MKKVAVIVAALVLASMVSCGSGGDDVYTGRGDTSVKATILGVQDCGYVTFNIGLDTKLYRGTDTWDFTPNEDVIFYAYPGPDCAFDGWGGDCAFAGQNDYCQLTVDKQYNITATFVAVI
jgi:hypothetical protein